jgi:hypothetical protein
MQPDMQIGYGTRKHLSDESISDLKNPLKLSGQSNRTVTLRAGAYHP